MIEGYFGDNGELFFEIELVAVDGSVVYADALLDTGFSDWLAVDIQDVESLGWQYLRQKDMQTAWGEARFSVYEGIVIFDGEKLTIPVLVGEDIPEILIGLNWLEEYSLVVNKKAGILTLERN